MQITRAEVTPVELKLRHPARMAGVPEIDHVTVLFVRLETRQGRNAWGCAVAHPDITGETPEAALQACQACAQAAPGLHPLNIEYSLAELAPLAQDSPGAACAFDLAFHDLLGLAADLPLYRLFGGYRNRIQSSATVPIAPVQESVEIARERARLGFQMLKIKGGLDPAEDVRRIKAIHRALPEHILRLDADGGYTVREALDLARALGSILEMLEQPTAAEDIDGLRQVTRLSPVPVLADQGVKGPAAALDLAAERSASGLNIKVARCGGLLCARQIDNIGRAAQLVTMVGSVIEPALLTAAGLSLALSSPNVRYGDLDGYLDLTDDPTRAGFHLEDGWLVASETPGLGCTVELN
jgi:L-alanine-DL-glutamate epimerase-like enolase superfamily enzyme